MISVTDITGQLVESLKLLRNSVIRKRTRFKVKFKLKLQGASVEATFLTA